MNTKNSLVGCGIVLVSTVLMSACGGGGSSSGDSTSSSGTPPAANTKTGVLLDSAVSNIHYQTETQSGTTNANGEFTFQDGETVTFSIGSLTFPATPAGTVVTPVSIAGASAVSDPQASNIARLLQSLDEDGNPANGISIPAAAATVAAPVDFNVDAATFEGNSMVINLVANSGSSNTTLVSATDAEAHVSATLDGLSNGIIGTWRITNGDEFSYLVLLNDNTFLYAENDPTVQAPQNGVELGTYTFDPNTGKITLTILYDDNAPGTDSGAGDIGTPAVFDLALSAGNTVLSVTNAGLDFDAVDFAGASSALVGAWTIYDSTTGEFEYLVLMPDGTFLYAENDPTVQAPQNGLEVGTYTVDSNAGTATFTITYDDNAPGADSGIGDIGTPATIDFSLSNSNNTLTAAGGTLVFARAL